jgi:hypothetical protein
VYVENIIPYEWREEIVIPILKKETEGPQNYRVMNILNTCCKIYSKIINTKLQQEMVSGKVAHVLTQYFPLKY